MVLRIELALGQELLLQEIRGISILSVDHDQDPVALGFGERLDDGAIVDHQASPVGHKELDAGHTTRRQGGDLVLDGSGQVADHGVEAVIDRRGIGGILDVTVQAVVEAVTFILKAEVDDAGRATAGGRDRAAPIVVGGDGALAGRSQVGVWVDAAGQDVLAGRVDDTRR